MIPAFRKQLGPIMAVIIALALIVPSFGSTAAQGERDDGATVDTRIEIVTPTNEIGLVVFIVANVGDSAADGDERLFKHDYTFSIPD